MREIVFRGKRLDNGKWEYGGVSKSLDKECKYQYNIHPVIKDYGECPRIEPNTLGQFTGLCDKNGKKIFEGDIVICDFDYKIEPMEVIFYKGGFKLKSDKCKEPYDYSIHDDDANPDLLVVGNIHDNPELLEGV